MVLVMSQADDPTPKRPAEGQDVVALGGPTEDGKGVHVLRARGDRIEAGELRPTEEGKPIVGELVKLEPRKDTPHICDVRESYRPPAAAAPRKGPARVTGDGYREGWDRVFGGAGAGAPDRNLN